jgi:glycine/D-amino acid oxidase-like deaminating enzyme
VLDPVLWQASLEQARKARATQLAAMPLTRRRGGLIDVTQDQDRVPVIPGVFLATGFYGRGFGCGPGVGRLAADLAAGDRPLVDPARVGFSRFTERPRRGG